LHGFTQNSQSWAAVVDHLPPVTALAPDLPGHGGSSGVAADLWQTAEVLAALVPQPTAWVGYSMGGRAALHVALAHPEKVSRLVLVSTSAGIAEPGLRAERARSDARLAARLEAGGDEALPGFLEEWLAQPLFATLPRDAADLGSRLANTAAGLASSLRLAGAGAQEPLWERLPELGRRGLPVLVLAGELDQRYSGHAMALARAIGPSARARLLPGAGHACHLEQPEGFARLVAGFCLGA
jgi:2-succinyl-6-hydroxy-2,4-cyclohexadiene-1-carboxylate synthase